MFEYNNLVHDFIFFQKSFPNLIFDEMVTEYLSQDSNIWIDDLLYYITYSTYHDSYRILNHEFKDTVKDLTYKQFKELIDVIRFNSDDLRSFICSLMSINN